MAEKILKTLKSKGHKAYLAGGCVRDLILKRFPKDLDIASDASPEQIESYFEKTLDVGKEFGTIRVLEGELMVEVTRFRKDGNYSDGRHPEKVEASNLNEDAKRRDFTINAIYFDPLEDQYIDLVEGQQDLVKALIRTVGEPHLRFSEDHLRLLRALRFSSELDFEIESKTLKAIYELSSNVKFVSKERVLVEIEKLVKGKFQFRVWEHFFKSGMSEAVFPGCHFNQGDPSSSIGLIMNYAPQSLQSLITLLGYLEVSKGYPSHWRRLLSKFPLKGLIKRDALWVAENLEEFKNSTDFYWRTKVMEGPKGLDLIKLWEMTVEDKGEIERFLAEYLKVTDKEGKLAVCFVTGNDLLNLGFNKGPLVGKLIEQVHRLQIVGKIKSKAQAIGWLKTRL